MAETSYQIIEVSSSLCDWERATPSAIKISALIFVVKNSTMKLSRLNIFREYAKKLKVKSRSRSRPRLQI